MSKRTIAIDFDGVIHRYSKGWHDGTCYDVPMEGAFDAIRTLRARGFDVVIFTARPLDQVEKWMIKNWPCEEGWGGMPIATNGKPIAIAYIDDRAVRFTNWRDMLNYF